MIDIPLREAQFNRVFVFPESTGDNSFYMHLDEDNNSRTFGKYIPPYVRFSEDLSLETLGYMALDACRIRGRIRDAQSPARTDDGDIYLHADVLPPGDPRLRHFRTEQIIYGNAQIASWVLDVMQRMNLIRTQ